MNLNDEAMDGLAARMREYNGAAVGTEERIAAGNRLDDYAAGFSEKQLPKVVGMMLRRGLS